MKNYYLLAFAIFVLIIFKACTKPQTPHNKLTPEEITGITSEIIAVSDQWITDNKNMDADAAIQFWSTSPKMRFAENGEFFANRDSVLSTVRHFYTQTSSMDVKWLNREVLPLTKTLALLSGNFHFKLGFKDESTWEGTNAFTGVFIHENGKWSLIQAHESVQSK